MDYILIYIRCDRGKKANGLANVELLDPRAFFICLFI